MKIFGILLLGLIVGWIVWASASTGGLHELRQINPAYVHPNKSISFLVSKLHYSKNNGFWDRYHVEQCSIYMPNWEKAEVCVNVRIQCENELPITKDPYKECDIFSEKFHSCWYANRPFMGLIEWLRVSRDFWRIGILFGAIKITGGWDLKGDDAIKWNKENKGWYNPLFEWSRRGD